MYSGGKRIKLQNQVSINGFILFLIMSIIHLFIFICLKQYNVGINLDKTVSYTIINNNEKQILNCYLKEYYKCTCNNITFIEFKKGYFDILQCNNYFDYIDQSIKICNGSLFYVMYLLIGFGIITFESFLFVFYLRKINIKKN